jgi:putative transposase
LYQGIRRELGLVLRSSAEQWERKVEGNLMPDDAHILLCVPPKHSVVNVMGFIKGKSTIHIARVYAGRRSKFVGQHFWREEVTGCQRSAKTRLPCLRISRTRKREANASNHWNWWRFEPNRFFYRIGRFTLSQASGIPGAR